MPYSSQQKSPATSPNQDGTAFSDAVVGDVLNRVRDGLESHSPGLLLSAFDKSGMDTYSAFEDQIRAFFNRYESFRVRYRIAETTTDQTGGVALVDFEMEQVPRDENAPPQRRIAQLRFEFKRGPKGWKIVDLRPRAFFS